MKFEIMSFLGALTVYLVRLRVIHIGGSQPVYSHSFMDERAHLFIPTTSPASPQSDSQSMDDASSQPSPASSSTYRQSGARLAWDAFLDSGSHDVAVAIRCCGKAVAVSAFFLLLRILNT